MATSTPGNIAGSANYLGKNDPIGKEAGFGAVVAAAKDDRIKAIVHLMVTSPDFTIQR